MPLRQFVGALLYDGARFERAVRGSWQEMHNRHETITIDSEGAVRCEWQWTSPVDYCRFVPGADRRLLRASLREWPISLVAEAPPVVDQPEVSFLIGHRGLARLPHLLATLRSIAGQRDASIECIVIEQAASSEIASELPGWVRYVHQQVGDGEPYCRSATFNLGATLTRGRLLVFHDNDILVPERYAAELLRVVEHGFDVLDLKRFIYYLTEADSLRVIQMHRVDGDEHSDVIQNLRGGSIAMTTEAFEAIGGFDEEFVGWGGEDNELWERAETRRSTRFGYLPLMHLWHAPQPEKLQGSSAPAVERYVRLAAVPAAERIAALRARRAQPSAGNG